MRALRVIAIAFLTAVAGGVLSVVASLYLTELYHVSNFEGGRGMLILFALAPLGLIIGFIIGLIVALRSRGTGFGGFVKAQGIALGIAIGGASQFIKLKLRAKPRKEDEAWSDWITATETRRS